MKTVFRRIALFLLVLCMIAGMAACKPVDETSDSSPVPDAADEGDAESEVAHDYSEPLTIDLYAGLGNYNGELVGWPAKVYKDLFNIDINMTSPGGDDTVFQTRAVSGDLGDIVCFGSNTQHFTDSIETGLLLDWYQDDLFAERGTAMAQYTDAIDKMVNNYGDGTALYGMLNNVSSRSPLESCEATELTYGSFMRYDIYKEIGSPEIKTLDDLYPVLKQMHEAHPETEDGEPVYVFTLFGDWDGALMTQAKQFGAMYGYDEISGGSAYILQKYDASDYQSIFDPNGYYVKGLKIYNQAYREGLLDPDSLTQDWDQVHDKVLDGQVLYVWWSWLADTYNTPENTSEGRSMSFVPITDETIVSSGCRPAGENYKICIGANCQDPERCMDFINWMYTPEGAMTLRNGPEGLTWEMVDGRPVFTEFGLEAVPTTAEIDVPEEYGGSDYNTGSYGIFWDPAVQTDINPETNESYTWRTWSSYLESKVAEIDPRWTAYEEWCNDLGTTSQKQYCQDHDQIAVIPATDMSVPPLDSDLSQIQGQVQNTVREKSWQMVYAESDAEFEALLAEMTEMCEGFGVDQLDEFYANYLLELEAATQEVIASAQ